MARFFDPATMASVWQLGASGPMNPAMSLKTFFNFIFEFDTENFFWLNFFFFWLVTETN